RNSVINSTIQTGEGVIAAAIGFRRDTRAGVSEKQYGYSGDAGTGSISDAPADRPRFKDGREVCARLIRLQIVVSATWRFKTMCRTDRCDCITAASRQPDELKSFSFIVRISFHRSGACAAESDEISENPAILHGDLAGDSVGQIGRQWRSRCVRW